MTNLVASISLTIEDTKPISLNNAYATSSSHYKVKSTKTQEWLTAFKYGCLRSKEKLDNFRKMWLVSKHYLLVNYIFFIPKKNMLIKGTGPNDPRKGKINSSSGDWSNITKIPDDMLFNNLLGIDDSYIATGRVDKLLSPNGRYYLKIRIQMRNLEDLEIRSKKEAEFLK